MSRVQDTLRKVVDAGWYGSDAPSRLGSPEFMCHALRQAASEGLITQKQAEAAGIAIREYMLKLSPGSCVMSWALHNAGLLEDGASVQWARTAGKEFYKNWDNRPRKRKAVAK